MLRVLNQYCHGFALAPVAIVCVSKGLFSLLDDTSPMSERELALKLGANPGTLRTIFDMFEVLNWLQRQEGGYVLGPKVADSAIFNPAMLDLYDYSPVDLVCSDEGSAVLSRWLDAIAQGGWGEAPLSLLFEGPAMLPMLIGAMQSGNPKGIAANDAEMFPGVKSMRNVLLAKKWAVADDEGYTLNGVGRFMLGRSMIGGVTVSYRPMLRRMETLLFDDDNIFLPTRDGVEAHIDRTLNVQSSGFQHEKYFGEMEKLVNEVFSRENFEDLPSYFADMGCGDGSLLKRLYEVVDTVSDIPVTMLGIDLNQAALDEAAKTLEGVPCHLMSGDIADPDRVLKDFREQVGGDPRRIMHVRSFLDHNRPCGHPDDTGAATRRTFECVSNCGIGPCGELIPAHDLQQNLVEHLRGWASILTGGGLLCLECHCMTRQANAANFELAEGFHFDALHSFSRQFLCAPQMFIAALAEVGLFAEHDVFQYPKGLPYTRITLGYYERKPYAIRFACEDDLQFFEDAATQWADGVRDEPTSSFVALDESGVIMGLLVCRDGGFDEETQSRRISVIGGTAKSSEWEIRLDRHCRQYFCLMDGEPVFDDDAKESGLADSSMGCE